ncbi:MAG: carboxypeptidase regulatory-like domain-containing protein, partial [Thermoanaerobaculia bacterium]
MRTRFLLALFLLFSATSVAAAVTGWVITPDGRPVADATVTLSRYESQLEQHQRLLTGSALEPLASARSSSKGAFTIEAPGEVLDLRVTAPGHSASFRRVTADDEVGALILRKAPSRTGVVRSAGKPVAGATVVWMIGGTEFISKTDEAGRYSAPDSDSSAWRAVIHPDFAIDHQVIRRAKVIPWDVSLVRGSAVSARVVGFDGAPVPGARVVVDGWPSATTSEDGTFTIPHIPPSWQTMVISAWGLAGLRHSGGKLSRDIPLRRTSTLSGTVIDARTGKPVPGALVFASGMTGVESVQADAKGRYVLTVRAGAYRSYASHPAYWSPAEAHDLIPGSTIVHNPGLMPFARINGTVTDEKKEAVVGAAVHAAQRPGARDGQPPISSIGGFSTGPDGRFAVRVRNGSQISVVAWKTGLPRGRSEELEVAAGELKRDVSIVIPRGHLVTGRVSDSDRRPLAGVTVAASEVAGNNSAFWYAGGIRTALGDGVETTADGTFSMRVQEGSFDLVFRRAGLSTAVARAVAVSTQTEPVEMTMTPSIDITGRVVQKGTAVAGASISASQGVGHVSATTEPDGSFILADLRKGPTRISISLPESFLTESRTLDAPASDVLIELPEGGRISGRVIDKKSRQPIPTFSAGISLSQGLSSRTIGPRKTRSSEDGSFTLDGIGAGLVKVLVTAVGFAPATSPALTMEEGKSIDGVEIEMEPGVRLAGRVTAPDGSPLFGAMVLEVQSGGPGSVPSRTSPTTTDASGEYTFNGVAAGEKTYEFMHADYVSVRKDVKLEGRETRLDAQLE